MVKAYITCHRSSSYIHTHGQVVYTVKACVILHIVRRYSTDRTDTHLGTQLQLSYHLRCARKKRWQWIHCQGWLHENTCSMCEFVCISWHIRAVQVGHDNSDIYASDTLRATEPCSSTKMCLDNSNSAMTRTLLLLPTCQSYCGLPVQLKQFAKYKTNGTDPRWGSHMWTNVALVDHHRYT